MGGLLNETDDHPVGFDGVFIAREHVEVLEGDAAALARDGFNFGFKVGEAFHAGNILQGSTILPSHRTRDSLSPLICTSLVKRPCVSCAANSSPGRGGSSYLEKVLRALGALRAIV